MVWESYPPPGGRIIEVDALGIFSKMELEVDIGEVRKFKPLTLAHEICIRS